MVDILQTIASAEWIALGVIFSYGIWKWNKRLAKFMNELREEKDD